MRKNVYSTHFNYAIFQLHQISLGFFKCKKGDGLIHPFMPVVLSVPLLCSLFCRTGLEKKKKSENFWILNLSRMKLKQQISKVWRCLFLAPLHFWFPFRRRIVEISQGQLFSLPWREAGVLEMSRQSLFLQDFQPSRVVSRSYFA